MSDAHITIGEQDNVLLIGLNRPEKRNAFGVDTYLQLALAYGRLNDDRNLRCGLLYAHGDHFTGGLDLPQWIGSFSRGTFPELPAGGIDPMGLHSAQRLEKPMVMAVQGICLTIGIELMLATDIRVAASDTRFGQIEIKRGIYPVGGATLRLHQEIGWGNAMRYLLTGDEMSADEAYRLGLVQEITPPGKQFDRALSIARTVARQAPLGVQATLRSARTTRLEGEYAAAERLLPDLLPLMKSRDVQEGVAAFIERREAKFTGK